MPRPKRKVEVGLRENGRPLKKIDWDEVDKLLMAGCNGVQVAAYFDMHPQTFYERVIRERSMSFTDYSTQKKEKGNSFLLATQYKLALEKDKTMLVWLGKQRLEQREEPKGDDKFNGELKEFIEYLKQKYSKTEAPQQVKSEESTAL